MASCIRSRGDVIQNASRSHASLSRLALRAIHALLSGALLACAPPESDALEFWAAGSEGEVVAQLIPEFEAQHPGIPVHVQQIAWRGAHEKLLTAVVGGSTPDIAPLGNTWISEFATIGALDALDEPLSRSAIIHQSDYFPGAWDTNRFEGKQYGVPWYVDTRVLFYRRDLLAEAGFTRPPATWAEWHAMLSSLQTRFRARGELERSPMYSPLFEYDLPLALGLQQPEPLLRDGDRFGNFRAAGFQRALGFYASLFRAGLALYVEHAIGNKFDEFARGRFVFFFGGPWQIALVKERMPQELAGSWATAPLPGPDGPGSSLALGSSLVVFAGSKKKERAWQLLEYLSRADVQRRFYTLTGDLPPRRSSWADAALEAEPQVAAFRDQLERVEPTPAVPEWERIASEVAIVAERTALGVVSVEDAAADLDARTDRILEKRRWILERAAPEAATGRAAGTLGAEHAASETADRDRAAGQESP